MRAVLLLVVAGLAVAAAEQVLEPAASDDKKTVVPLMVSNLHGDVPQPHAAAHQVVGGAPHGFDGSAPLAAIASHIQGYEQTLEQLSHQLEATMKQSIKLKLTKKLMAGIVSLKKAERVLHAIDAAVAKAKAKAARTSEEIESTARAMAESEKSHKKNLKDMNRELDHIRASLSKHEKRLTSLAGRRGRVVAVVHKWRQHVATLRDAHESYSAGAAAAAKGRHHRVSLESALAEPPSASKVLADLGLSAAAKDAALLRGSKGPIDLVLKSADAANTEAALAQLQRSAGMRFAGAEAGADADLEREAAGLENELAEEGGEDVDAAAASGADAAEAQLAQAEGAVAAAEGAEAAAPAAY